VVDDGRPDLPDQDVRGVPDPGRVEQGTRAREHLLPFLAVVALGHLAAHDRVGEADERHRQVHRDELDGGRLAVPGRGLDQLARGAERALGAVDGKQDLQHSRSPRVSNGPTIASPARVSLRKIKRRVAVARGAALDLSQTGGSVPALP
jgi:hypothetical protein